MTTAVTHESRWKIHVDAAERQCIGATFEPRRDDLKVAHALMSGTLILPPHPPAELDDEPKWDADPFHDYNWQFQFHTLRWVDVLRRAAKRRRPKLFRSRYEYLLRHWIEHNPRRASPSRFSWNDMATGQRALVLVHAATVFSRAPWLVEALVEHGEALADEDFYAASQFNHSLHESLGLLAVAGTLRHQQWVDLATRRVGELLASSVDEQGVANEGSVEYQLLNHRWYEEAAERIRACDRDVPPVFDRLRLMPQFLAHATTPDGHYEMLGDTVRSPAAVLPATDAEYAATRGARGTAPATKFVSYDEGYVFGRSGWGTERSFQDETFYSMRTGSRKASHAHEDVGALTLHAYGRQLLFDSGKYAYGGGDERAYVRSRAAHNVVDALGCRYRLGSPVRLLAAEHHPSYDLVSVQSSCFQDVTWIRTVLFSRRGGYLVVDDQLEAQAEATFVQRWHLAEDRAVAVEENRVSTTGEGANLALFWFGAGRPELGVVSGRREPMLGWRSYRYRQISPAPVVEATRRGRSVRFSVILAPLPAGSAPDTFFISRLKAGRGHLSARVVAQDHIERFRLTPTEASVRPAYALRSLLPDVGLAELLPPARRGQGRG